MAFDGDWSAPGIKNWGTDSAGNKAQQMKDAAAAAAGELNPLPQARSALVSLGLLVLLGVVVYSVTK